MQKLLYTFLLLALIAVCPSLTSCLSDDTNYNTNTYSDCAISAFSLGNITCYTHYQSSKGTDSIVKATVVGSTFKFSIDQLKHEIYNVDSLPAGTDSLHILCNISAKNGGVVCLKSPTSDSLSTYSSSDSISFLHNPRTVVVYSNNGQYFTKYTVKLNIHREVAQKMTWNAPHNAAQFADADRLQTTEWKTVAQDGNGKGVVKDSIVVKVAKAGNVLLYTSPAKDGKTWEPITPDTKLSETASIAAIGGMLYTTDASGVACKSADGKTWTPISANDANVTGEVIGISNGKLYMLSKNGGDGISSYNTVTGEYAASEAIYGNASCAFDPALGISLCEIKKDSKVTGTSIVGSTGSGKTVLYKAENTAEQQKWMALGNDAGLNLPNSYAETVSYGKYLLALSQGKLYTSTDSGRSWQTRWFIYAPSSLSTENAHIYADSHGMLWIISKEGNIHTGKLNEVAWE